MNICRTLGRCYMISTICNCARENATEYEVFLVVSGLFLGSDGAKESPDDCFWVKWDEQDL